MITRWEPDILKTKGSKPIFDNYKKNLKKEEQTRKDIEFLRNSAL